MLRQGADAMHVRPVLLPLPLGVTAAAGLLSASCCGPVLELGLRAFWRPTTAAGHPPLQRLVGTAGGGVGLVKALCYNAL